MSNAFSEYVARWEKKNGPLKLPKEVMVKNVIVIDGGDVTIASNNEKYSIVKSTNMRLFIFALFTITIGGGCNSKQTYQHPPMPDKITVEKTANHITQGVTNLFVVPPAGFDKAKHDWCKYSFKTNAEFSVGFSARDVKIPLGVDEVRKQLEKDGKEVKDIKKISYNGTPALYYESVSMGKFYHMRILVPLKDSTTMFINGSYSYETDSVTEKKIMGAMQTVYYDENYKQDERTAVPYQLDDTRSAFKYAGHESLFYWYTLRGKDPASKRDEPYLIMFMPWKMGGRPEAKNTLSYKNELEKPNWGFKFKAQKSYKPITLANHEAHQFVIPAIDRSGHSVNLLFTEVIVGSQNLIILGVATNNNEATIEAFRKLTETLTIKEDD